jgi:hypothetical protein
MGRRHKILGDEGHPTQAHDERIHAARDRVRALVGNEQWHAGPTILSIGGTEGLRRFREVRREFDCWAKRHMGSGVWEYRVWNLTR